MIFFLVFVGAALASDELINSRGDQVFDGQNVVVKISEKEKKQESPLKLLAENKSSVFLLIVSFVPNKEKNSMFQTNKLFLEFFYSKKNKILADIPTLSNCPMEDNVMRFSFMKMRPMLQFADNREIMLNELSGFLLSSMLERGTFDINYKLKVKNEEILLVYAKKKRNVVLNFGKKMLIGFYFEADKLVLVSLGSDSGNCGFIPRIFSPIPFSFYFHQLRRYHELKPDVLNDLEHLINFELNDFKEGPEFVQEREMPIELDSSTMVWSINEEFIDDLKQEETVKHVEKIYVYAKELRMMLLKYEE